MYNLQIMWLNICELFDGAVQRFNDPRRIARQVIKLLGRQICALENGYVEILTRYDLLLKDIQENNQEVIRWTERIRGALEASNETLAGTAAAEVIRRQQLIERMSEQLCQLEPIKNNLRQQIQEKKAEKEDLENQVEILCAEYSLAKTKSEINKLLGGVGNPDGSIQTKIQDFKKQVNQLESKNNAQTIAYNELSGGAVEAQFRSIESTGHSEKAKQLVAETRKLIGS
jgi:phage shock protein A